MAEIEVRRVHIDDLYPKSPAEYDPDCCCAMCLDISIAKARRQEAAMYRQMRRDGQGKLARLVWKKSKRAIADLSDRIAQDLFYSDSNPTGPKTGLAALLADYPNG
jgi:hypothetical protein